MLNIYDNTDFIINKDHKPHITKGDLDSSSYILLFPNKDSDLIVNFEDSQVKILEVKDLLKLFRSTFNWCYSPNHEIDCAFRVLNEDQALSLHFTREFTFEINSVDYKITWYGSKISLHEGSNSRTIKNLINIYPFTSMDDQTQNLSLLKSTVSKYKLLHPLPGINLISPAAMMKDILLSYSEQEFYYTSMFPRDFWKEILRGYIGPRQETRFLGMVGSQNVLDMIKAFLRELALIPSLNRSNIIGAVEGQIYHPEAHPGSTYKISTTIPDDYNDFPPIPVRDESLIKYPIGLIEETIISKPYIDLLIEDRIPFTILDSHQVLIKDLEDYSFKTFSNEIENTENALSEFLKPINIKLMHYPLIGHMLHISKRWKRDSEGFLTSYYETGPDFNPLVANAVQAQVAVKAWRNARKSGATAITVDGNVGKDLKPVDGWKDKGTGPTFFFNANLKDKGGSTDYQIAVYKQRDNPRLHLISPNRRRGFDEAWMWPELIGKPVTREVDIKPSGGYRRPKKPIVRLGDLLDGSIPTIVPLSKEEFESEALPLWLLNPAEHVRILIPGSR